MFSKMTIEMSVEMERVLTGSSLPLFERAAVFSSVAHSKAKRKGGRIPYLVHPMEAAAIVAEMTDDEELVAAAVLHDVVEDTAATVEDLRRYFGERVAHYVSQESENKRKELPAESTWKLRKQETITFLTNEADRNAKILALADKLSNLRSVERDERSIGEKLWERFNQKDKSLHGWMYRQIAEALRELEAFPAWQEYDRLIKKVFENQDGL